MRRGSYSVVLSLLLALAVVLASCGGGGGGTATAGHDRSGAATCDGSAALCGKRLDQVVFPGTHNSYAAAEEPAGTSPANASGSASSWTTGSGRSWSTSTTGSRRRTVWCGPTSPPRGDPPWYMPAFSYIQDTPLGANRPDQLSCARFRGEADSPLLLINHWIPPFPPSPRLNAAIGTAAFLRHRVRRCMRERGTEGAIVAVDFYERTAVVRIARELNG